MKIILDDRRYVPSIASIVLCLQTLSLGPYHYKLRFLYKCISIFVFSDNMEEITKRDKRYLVALVEVK